MEQLSSTIFQIVDWLKIPSYAVLAACILIGGYNIYNGGQDGMQKGKKWIMGGIAGTALVQLASVLGKELQGKITAGIFDQAGDMVQFAATSFMKFLG